MPLVSDRRGWALQIGLVFGVLFWIVAWHWDTASSMAAIWWRSETFAHGMIVYPISLWLIWRRRAILAQIRFQPSLWILGPLVAACFGWLMADLAGVQAARHFSLVAMIALAVWVVVGTRFARQIAFPLAFTLLAVPVGEFLLPILMEHTADFTVGALRLTGIPVYREGNNFIVPSGSWSVVEACSGLRYLIASLTLGLLYAYLSYTSPMRRFLFIVASLVVPVIANWVRAYMIVMIGHLSGMKYAVGVDHLLYGWIFFGIVMLLLFWIGGHWREDTDKVAPAPFGSEFAGGRISPSLVLGALLTAAVVAAAPTYAGFLDAREERSSKVVMVMPQAANGWVAASYQAPPFRPHYIGGRASVEMSFERDGRQVGLFIGYYAQQREGAELVSFQNAIVTSSNRHWRQLSQSRVVESQTDLDVMQTRLRSASNEFVVWHWYWAGERRTVRPQLVKIRQALDRLLGAGDDAAVVVLYAQGGSTEVQAEAGLRAFYQDMGPAIDAALSQTRHARNLGQTGLTSTAQSNPRASR